MGLRWTDTIDIAIELEDAHPDADVVGVVDERGVGGEDGVHVAGGAELLLCDLAEGVAALHGVGARLGEGRL